MPPRKNGIKIPPPKKPNVPYSVDDVVKAVEAIKKGMSLRKASEKYGVPRTTLLQKHKGITPIKCKQGPDSVLKEDQEIEIMNWIKEHNKLGFMINKIQVCDSVQTLLNITNQESKFVNNRPGRHWFVSFLKRHPEVFEDVSPYSASKAIASDDEMKSWHAELSQYLKSKNLDQLPASRIFVFEDVEFSLDLQEDEDGIKESFSALFGANASGNLLPPKLTFSNEEILRSSSEMLPENWTVSYIDREKTMFSEIFYRYVTETFYPWIQNSGTNLPVLIYINGSKSHISMPLSHFCKAHKIELVIINQKISNSLQILDVGLLHSLRNEWNEILKKVEDSDMNLTLLKHTCAQWLNDVIATIDYKNNLQKAFNQGGLYPLSFKEDNFQKLVKQNAKEKKALKQPGLKINPQLIGHFNYLNKHIDPEILAIFKQCEGSTWHGDIRYEGLFNVWYKIKRKVYYEYKDHPEIEPDSKCPVPQVPDPIHMNGPESSGTQQLITINSNIMEPKQFTTIHHNIVEGQPIDIWTLYK